MVITQGQNVTLIYQEKPGAYAHYYLGIPGITEKKIQCLDIETIILYFLSYVNVFQVYDSYRWRAIDKTDMNKIRKQHF